MNGKIRRIAHRLFFTVLAGITLLILFYAEENWRGARAWEAVRRGLQARGESLDWKTFIPSPVPDEQNLALAPLFVRAFRYRVDPVTRLLTFGSEAEMNNDTFTELEQMPSGPRKPSAGEPKSPPSWMSAHRTDLARWQQYYRQREDFPRAPQPQTPADDVLLALSRYAPQFDELARMAAERPQMRFPINWTQQPPWSIRMPHYIIINKLSAALRLRAAAELTAGQTAPAMREIELMFRLHQAVANDPIAIAVLVDVSVINSLLQPVWEGLADQRWTAADLDRLRERLRGIDMLRSSQQAMRGERAMNFGHLPEELQDRTRASGYPQAIFSTPYSVLPYLPRGWYARNAALACRLEQEYQIDAVDPANHRVAPGKSKDAEKAVTGLPMTPNTFLVKIVLPLFTSLFQRFAQTQAAVDQAIIACALEKYYLDHHAYPAALDALVPAYLDRVPNDVIDGAPMRYRLTVDGRYQLYSVGWDGKDEGGVIEWPADRRWRRAVNGVANEQAPDFPNPSRERGDCVWQYAPAVPPEPPANQSQLESLPSPLSGK